MCKSASFSLVTIGTGVKIRTIWIGSLCYFDLEIEMTPKTHTYYERSMVLLHTLPYHTIRLLFLPSCPPFLLSFPPGLARRSTFDPASRNRQQAERFLLFVIIVGEKMMSADESGTKTTQLVRSLLAVCFFCMGMWLAKDSGANFLRGDIEETAKDATLVGNIKGEETTPVPAPQRSGGAPKPKNQDKGAIEDGDKEGMDEGKDLPFRFCNGMEKVHTPTDEKNGFHLRYRCIGPEYDAFADHLHAFVEKDRPNHHPLWGKRGIPANQTFLILGSSHLQQVAQ